MKAFIIYLFFLSFIFFPFVSLMYRILYLMYSFSVDDYFFIRLKRVTIATIRYTCGSR